MLIALHLHSNLDGLILNFLGESIYVINIEDSKGTYELLTISALTTELKHNLALPVTDISWSLAVPFVSQAKG